MFLFGDSEYTELLESISKLDLNDQELLQSLLTEIKKHLDASSIYFSHIESEEPLPNFIVSAREQTKNISYEDLYCFIKKIEKNLDEVKPNTYYNATSGGDVSNKLKNLCKNGIEDVFMLPIENNSDRKNFNIIFALFKQHNCPTKDASRVTKASNAIKTIIQAVEEKKLDRVRSIVLSKVELVASTNRDVYEVMVDILREIFGDVGIVTWSYNEKERSFSIESHENIDIDKECPGHIEINFSHLGDMVKNKVTKKVISQNNINPDYKDYVYYSNFNETLNLILRGSEFTDFDENADGNQRIFGGVSVLFKTTFTSVPQELWGNRVVETLQDHLSLLMIAQEKVTTKKSLDALVNIITETRVKELEPFFDGLLNEILQLLPAESGNICIRDFDENELYLISSTQNINQTCNRCSLDVMKKDDGRGSLVGRVLREGKPKIIYKDDEEKVPICRKGMLKTGKIHTALSVPLRIGHYSQDIGRSDEILGVLSLHNRKTSVKNGKVRSFTQDDVELLSEISQICANFIEKIKIIKEKEKALLKKDEAIMHREEEQVRLEKSLNSLRHEALAPIQPIIDRMQLFERTMSRKQAFNSQIEHQIRDILSEARQLEFLIEGVSVITDDDFELMRSRKNFVKSVIHPIINMLERKAEAQKGMIIEFKSKVGLPKLSFDVNRCKQVVYNLLDNTIKYSTKDSKKIVISTDRQKGNPVLMVKNWGLGIPQDYEKEIFERGVKAPNANKEKVGGTGLGLTICEKIVEKHDWKISVSSRSNPTIFKIEMTKDGEIV